MLARRAGSIQGGIDIGDGCLLDHNAVLSYGASSRLYRAAIAPGAGQVRMGGVDQNVSFEQADAGVLNAVDAAAAARARPAALGYVLAS